MKRDKPYFTEAQVERLVETITTEMTLEARHYDDNTIAAIRKYVQAAKNAYENSILSGVIDGIFTACVIKDEMAYKVVPPSGDLPREALQLELHKRASRLTHAMNMITLYGKNPKLEV